MPSFLLVLTKLYFAFWAWVRRNDMIVEMGWIRRRNRAHGGCGVCLVDLSETFFATKVDLFLTFGFFFPGRMVFP